MIPNETDRGAYLERKSIDDMLKDATDRQNEATFVVLMDTFVRLQREHELSPSKIGARQAASEADVALWNFINSKGINQDEARQRIREALGRHPVAR